MSWDHILKSIKCPCGQGTIEKDTRSDDWGRYEEGSPYINCPKCESKYCIRTITHTRIHKGIETYSYHYLVPKNIDLSVNVERKYPRVDVYELKRKDFPHSLIVEYKLSWLLSAQEELNQKTSVASLKGYADSIAKDRKRYVGSAKINEVRNDVATAIQDHKSFIVNKEQLEEQEEIFRKAEQEQEDKIIKNGIPLDI